MSQFKALIAHGGGPTAVLNASLAGVADGCRTRASALYASRFGFTGALHGDMPDLLQISAGKIDRAALQPGSIIGSSRAGLSPNDLDRLVNLFRREEIRVVFYTGGNGSMQTALDLSGCARAVGFELQTIGVPKTIDNDLRVTHHTPGYPSTAYFFACAARDAGADNRSLPSPVCILETLGRHAGWIVAATALARNDADAAPQLIYFPERPLSLDRIAADVEAVYRRLGHVVIAVCEGQVDEKGTPFGADVDRPKSGVHRLASNLGHSLAKLLSERLGIRARAEKPGLIGRACGPFTRERDRREAYDCGRAAVMAAVAGHSDVMVALDQDGGTFLTPLDSVARYERLLPPEYIAEAGNDVTRAFREYATPLVGDIPGYTWIE